MRKKRTSPDTRYRGLRYFRTTYEEKNRKTDSSSPNFPCPNEWKAHILSSLRNVSKCLLYFTSLTVWSDLFAPKNKKRKGYWLLKPSLSRWINKASNGKCSSYLIAIAAFALTSTESDQWHGDPADLLNFPGCVLEGIVWVWMDAWISETTKKHNIKKLANIYSA